MNSILTDINSNHNLNDSNSPFLVSAAKLNNINKKDKKTLLANVKKLKESTNAKKVDFKKMLFESCDMEIAFKKSIANCMQYYKKHIPDACTSIYKQRLFMNNILNCFLNHESEHNENNLDDNSIEI